MKAALEKADRVLEGFEVDPSIKEQLREAIAQAILEERRTINNDIQHRLGCLRLAVMDDLDVVRREIEIVLHPTPLL